MDVDVLIKELRGISDPGDWNSEDVFDAVGRAIAYAAGWSGEPILACLATALTDANFHTEADVVYAMLAKLAGDKETAD